MRARVIFGAWMVAGYPLASPGYSSAAEIPILDVQATTGVDAGKKECVIGIRNRSNSVPLSKVRVALLDQGLRRFEVGPVDLTAEQAVVLSHEMGRGISCSGPDVFFRVAFEREGVRNEILTASTSEKTLSSSINWNLSQLVGPLFGLFAGLLGGWVAHFWTMAVERQKDRLTLARDRERDRVSWRTELFRTAEPAFRKFLLSWNLSLDAEALRAEFSLLQQAVVMHPDLMATYRDTYKVLATSSVVEDKRASAEKLEQAMRLYIQRIEPN